MKEYIDDDDNPHYNEHYLKVNKHFAIVSGTGGGKTNFVVNLLLTMNETFQSIYIFTGGLTNEPIYQMLSSKYKDHIIIKPLSEIIDFDQLPKYTGNKLVVFDDFIGCSKKEMEKILKYVTISRKVKCTCLFLTQNYYTLPKTITRNISYIVLLRMTDKRNLKMIISTLPFTVDVHTVMTIIQDATYEPLNCCIIDLSASNPNRIFRKNFTEFYFIE